MTRLALAAALAIACGCGGQPSGPAADATAAIDAGVPDGADAAFTCGQAICTADQLCYELAAGRAIDAGLPPDAAVEQPGCAPIPAACAADPTCDCLIQNVTTSCPYAPTCQISNGHPYLVCALP